MGTNNLESVLESSSTSKHTKKKQLLAVLVVGLAVFSAVSLTNYLQDRNACAVAHADPPRC